MITRSHWIRGIDTRQGERFERVEQHYKELEALAKRSEQWSSAASTICKGIQAFPYQQKIADDRFQKAEAQLRELSDQTGVMEDIKIPIDYYKYLERATEEIDAIRNSILSEFPDVTTKIRSRFENIARLDKKEHQV